jgi:hypothetical protein
MWAIIGMPGLFRHLHGDVERRHTVVPEACRPTRP